jgi:hypothetical protein
LRVALRADGHTNRRPNMLAIPSVLLLLGLVLCSGACIHMYGTVQEGLVSSSCLDQHMLGKLRRGFDTAYHLTTTSPIVDHITCAPLNLQEKSGVHFTYA